VRIIYVTSSMPYGPAETFLISEVEEVRKQGHEVLVVPMYPGGLRLELSGLREMGRQAFEDYNASYSWDDFAKEHVGLYQKRKIRPQREDR
jgi:hypothetical protein